MKYDIVIAGIGGQGVHTLSRIITRGAVRAGLDCDASEPGTLEGTRSRFIHLRMADYSIEGGGIAPATADLILGLEPLESLRHLSFLSPAGSLITSSAPIQDSAHYPPIADVLWSVLTLRSGFLVDATRLATAAGDIRAANSVLAGAASDFLPADPGDLRAAIIDLFSEHGTEAVELNLAAFEAGRNALRHREIVDEFTTFADTRR